VRSINPAPFTKLLKLDLFGDELFVLAGPVIYAFALGATEFKQSIL